MNEKGKNNLFCLLGIVLFSWHGTMQFKTAILPVVKLALLRMNTDLLLNYSLIEICHVLLLLGTIYLLTRLINKAKMNKKVLVISFSYYLVTFFVGYFSADILDLIVNNKIQESLEGYNHFMVSNLFFGLLHYGIEVFSILGLFIWIYLKR
jgi:hypothetical protein